MGYQQILYLALATVFVGLGILVSLSLFESSAVKSNEDAVRQDMHVMLTALETWFRTPRILGGGGRSFGGIESFADIGYEYSPDGALITGMSYENNNGVYQLVPQGNRVEIHGQLKDKPELVVKFQITYDAASFRTSISEISEDEN